jgi:hypothetical protein
MVLGNYEHGSMPSFAGNLLVFRVEISTSLLAN